MNAQTILVIATVSVRTILEASHAIAAQDIQEMASLALVTKLSDLSFFI